MVFYSIEKLIDERIGFREVHRTASFEEADRIAKQLTDVFSCPHRVATVTIIFSEPYGKSDSVSEENVE